MRIAPSMFAALVLVGVGSTPAHADIAGRYETVDEDAVMKMEMTIEADEHGNVRTQMPRLGAYYLVTDGEFYQVAAGKDGPLVIRLADLMTIQQEFAEEFFADRPEAWERQTETFAPMDEQTVGDRVGTGYGIVNEDNPEPQYALLVISDDAQLAPLGQALANSNEAMADSMSSWGAMGSVLRMMNDEMVAVLRKGAPLRMMSIELTDVSLDPIPPVRFALPAEPMTIEEIRARFSPDVEAPPTLPPYDD
ncbi:MAG: hypothetical protein V7686_02690 [Qipengyuania sp.]